MLIRRKSRSSWKNEDTVPSLTRERDMEACMRNQKFEGTKKIILSCASILFCLTLIQKPLWADQTADLTREIINKWQNAVITTKIVMEMYEYERKMEALATIIDPSGLAVLSLSNIDPSAASGLSSGTSGEEAKVKDVKMLMNDETEIPARVVLRDRDLDLAFIRPIEELKEPLFNIDLGDNALPEIMDQIVVLSRFGSIAGYVSAASLCRIQAVIEKPRVLYMPDPLAGLVSGLGTPVFSLNGKVVGILLLRVKKSREMMSNEMFRGMGGMDMLPVILPAQEVLDVVKKAELVK